MKSFNYQTFWNNVDLIEAKKKVSKEGKLNCSSNELVHSGLSKINIDLYNKLDINKINSYIYYPDKIKLFSELLKIPSNMLQLYAGSDDAIKIILTALGINCHNIIIQNPNYENYFCYAKLNQFTVTKWNMDKDYKFDVNEGLRLIITSEPSIIIVTSPNGFTGYTMLLKDIELIVKTAHKNNSIVLIDQAYASFDNVFYTELSFRYNNVIVISTLSKAFGLAGARLAYISANESIISYLSKWNGINAISALSYEIGQYYLLNKEIKYIVNEIVEEREKFVGFINDETPWHAYNSKANFVLISMNSEDSASNAKEFLNENKIIVRKLDVEPLKKCIRMTIVDAPNMKKIKELIKTYIIDIRKDEVDLT